MPDGAAWQFDDDNDTGNLTDDNVNSLDIGGNVYKTPGTTLQVNVSALVFWDLTGTKTLNTHAASTGNAVTASQTNYVYIDNNNALQINQSGFPDPSATDHIPLAEVTCDNTDITSITDKRPVMTMGGA